jgi:GNAT superfamily N-acetyltransferase
MFVATFVPTWIGAAAMPIEYRVAGTADLAELAAMRWDFRLEESGGAAHDRASFLTACHAFLQCKLAEGAWAYWIAIADGQIVAHIFVCRIDKVPKPNRLQDCDGYVTNVYTRPAYRGRGIGSALMKHVTTWALEQDMGTLFVWPSETSRTYYARAGFVGGSELMEYEVRPYVL